MSNNTASPASMQPFVMRHVYKDGRVSVWFGSFYESVNYWESVKEMLVEPCLSSPLKTSQQVWRVDHVRCKK